MKSFVLVIFCVFVHYSIQDEFFTESERQWWRNDTKDEQTHSCRYRNHPQLYPPEAWLYVTGAACYTYSFPETLNPPQLNPNYTCYTIDNITYNIPFVMINNTPVLFDYTNTRYVEMIRPLYRNDKFFETHWLECAEAAVDCCENYLTEENMTPTEDYPCPALWDGWTCYPQRYARATTVYTPCPTYSYTSDEMVCPLESEKYCLSLGYWNDTTNYVTCSSAPVYRRRHNYHVAALSASLALTIPALIIYVSFKKLWIFRIALNRNLLISIIVKNILTIMSKKIVILDSLKPTDQTNKVLENSGAGCKVLSFTENVSKTFIFTCMLVVGYFLHKSIARVFAGSREQTPNLYLLYLGVLVVSIIPSAIWAILMATNNMEYCWMVDNTTKSQWVTDGFKYFVLGVNLLLLLDIIRVLVYRRANLDSKKIKSAVKATLFLIPLFGVPLIFTGQRDMFNTETCRASDIYFYVTYAVEAAQGIVVAVLFCYLNREVHNEIRRAYVRFTTYMEHRWNIRLWRPRDNNRRQTATTNVRASSYYADPGNVVQKPAQNETNQWESFT